MTDFCQKFEENLVEKGEDLSELDAELLEHTKNCPMCAALLEALSESTGALNTLPELEAPSELVESTMQKIQAERIQNKGVHLGSRRILSLNTFVKESPILAAGLFLAGFAFLLTLSITIAFLYFALGVFFLLITAERKFLSLANLGVASAAVFVFCIHFLGGSIGMHLKNIDIQSSIESYEDTIATSPTSDLTNMPLSNGKIASVESVLRKPDGRQSATGFSKKSGIDKLAEVEEMIDAPPRKRFQKPGVFPGGATFGMPAEQESSATDFDRQNIPSRSESIAQKSEVHDELKFPAHKDVETFDEFDQEVTTDSIRVGDKLQQEHILKESKETSEIQNQIRLSGESASRSFLNEQDKNLQAFRGAEPSRELRSEKKDISPTDSHARIQSKLKKSSLAKQSIDGKIIPKTEIASKNRFPREKISQPNTFERFLQSREQVKNLQYQEARGYWKNTYVPGDPSLRKLHSDLLNQGSLGNNLAQPVNQPFDVPTDSAMAVYLHTDRQNFDSLTGATRMYVQVGLQATSQKSGGRPVMNAALVLDLREKVDAQAQKLIESLLHAFERNRDARDSFSLVVAGPGGGTLIEPGSFRHGTLQVALSKIFQGNEGKPSITLPQALEAAGRLVKHSDDSSAPLGGSAILLISPSNLGYLTSTLSAQAHNLASDGVIVSTIGIGDHANNKELASIALSGQGNRRMFTVADDSKRLVQDELTSVSRVVARALRLRIRLAPGVKLVNILGSYRLDEQDANRERQAEQSIDKRLAKNLGIQADRGEDEEGTQIIIPAFYAGDSHAIVLDVVATQPGPVADVQLRYKDLVHLKNGVSRANLNLDVNGTLGQGALELNVLKNALAYHLSSLLQDTSTSLAHSDSTTTMKKLSAYRELLSEVRSHFSALSTDADLIGDENLLSTFIDKLNRVATANEARTLLSQSLELAGKMKVQHPLKD